MFHRKPCKTVLSLLILVTLAFPSVFAAAQDAGDTPIIEFTTHPQNPVFIRDSDHEWGGECGTIFAPQILQHENVWYLFYSGSCNRSGRPAAIGYATSSDGIHWNRHDENPILEPDGEGYDAMCVSIGVPIVEDNEWVLYFAANSTPCAGPGQHIGRATAENANGPWQRSTTPVLEAGETGEWDQGFIMPHAVIRTEAGYVMYYSGGDEFLLPLPRLVGMAVSTDGIHWTKYDDPETTAPPYAHSDPILEINQDGSLSQFSAWSIDVQRTAQGWEMFFSTACPDSISQGCPTFIGYAISDDGIHWRMFRSPESAVITRQQVDQDWASYCVCHPTFYRTDSEYRLYFTGCTEEMNDCQIGMAAGTITWEQP